MRNNEPIDLAKTAIGIMLLCLLIGATVSFFYMIYDKTDERIDSMQKAATSSNMERLYELQDKTLADTGDMSGYPLGPLVANVLTEFSEESLLYIQVTTPQGIPGQPPTTTVYTYTDITNITGVDSNSIDNSDLPVTAAVKKILAHSDCRAAVYLHDDTDYGLIGVQVDLYIDPATGR